MNRFLSIPKKMVLLLFVLLLALSAAMSALWLQKTNQDFDLVQKDIRQQNHSQFELLNQMFRNRIETWVELLVQLHQNQPNQIDALAKTLATKYEFLQLNLQVEGLWLFKSDGTVALQSQNDIPPRVLVDVKQVFAQQSSIKSTYCDTTCTEIMSIPILERDGTMAVITLSIELIDTLAFLNRSTKGTLAVVYVAEQTAQSKAIALRIRGPLAQRQSEFIQHAINSFDQDMSVDTLLQQGAQLKFKQETFFATLIPMSTVNPDIDYLLSAHNITPIVQAHQSYQKRIMVTAAAFFLTALLLFYALTNSIRKRLNLLASRLPLLAHRDYSLFRAQSRHTKHYFRDELDTLNDSATELAEQLELLDGEVLAKNNELENMAMFDQLTQLPNRNMLQLRMEKALYDLKYKPGYVVLLLFDLDDFKKVNDSYGHSVGDELLSEAAQRFQSVVRSSDLACRLGGDEFAILLKDLDDLDGAIKVAEKLLERFRAPINVEDLRFYVSTSIGLTFSDSTNSDVAEMIRCADIAMYHAKSQGGNRFAIFDESMSIKIIDKVSLEDEARGALLNNHFSFALQPQIELDSGKLVGFEALLRWNHPERGFVSPGYFIPILESSEFMLSIGYWCIERAFTLLKEFKSKGYPELKIAINLAGKQFLDPDLLPYLENKVKESQISADLLELELTERTLVSDAERTMLIMQQIIDKGFLISIDDFGTGYSSLSYLKKLPAHYIKIDRAFIDGMLTNEADKQIVTSTVAMVQKLNMKVIAEGIEEKRQVEMLSALGCDMAQGYLIAKPIPEAVIFDKLATHFHDGKWLYNKDAFLDRSDTL